MKINITLPIYNEEAILEKNVQKILDFIKKESPPLPLSIQWVIVLADNASTDGTAVIAKKIIAESFSSALPLSMKYLFIPKKGKGGAIKTGWQKFPADYYIFMDADIATDLEALPRLLAELKNGADVVIGSRYLPESKTKRSLNRKIISLIYRRLARFFLYLPFSDLPCGFKGVNQKIINEILPQIRDDQWFFDTELLYRAFRSGCRIKEIPVRWTESPDKKRTSRVGVLKVGWEYLKKMAEIRKQ